MLKLTKATVTAAAAMGALLAAAGAQAHHSFAMFDRTKEITLTGVVKEWQFTNPHAYLQMVSQEGAKTTEWSLETTAISSLLRRGLRSTTFSPGDKVSVVIHPLRNAQPGGELVSVTPEGGMLWKLY